MVSEAVERGCRWLRSGDSVGGNGFLCCLYSGCRARHLAASEVLSGPVPLWAILHDGKANSDRFNDRRGHTSRHSGTASTTGHVPGMPGRVYAGPCTCRRNVQYARTTWERLQISASDISHRHDDRDCRINSIASRSYLSRAYTASGQGARAWLSDSYRGMGKFTSRVLQSLGLVQWFALKRPATRSRSWQKAPLASPFAPPTRQRHAESSAGESD
jgi:hypothetical protein